MKPIVLRAVAAVALLTVAAVAAAQTDRPGQSPVAGARVFGAKGCNFTDGVPASGFQGDGHENAEGNTIIAKNMMRLLEPMLDKAKK